MSELLDFRIGSEEPAENVTISCPQVILLTNFDKAKMNSFRIVRKISRQELTGLGRPGRKGIGKLQSELLTNDSLHPITPSVDKTHVSEPSTSKSKKSKLKSSTQDSRTHASSPGNYHSQLMNPCPHCGCKRVRTVNPGRLDRRNIIECTNRECLATIKFTEAPEGILINPGVKEEFTWYDLDPEEIFYPSASTLKRLEESLKSDVKKPFVTPIRYDEQGNIVVRCPGQRQWVRMK